MSEKRELLLIEASKLIESRGYRNVNIQDITESAGISVGTFYNHFSSKDDLYITILRNLEKKGIERAERIVSRYHSPINKIRALYRFVTLGVRRNKILRGVLTRERDFVSPNVRKHLADGDDIRKRFEELFGEILREGAMSNVFRTGLYRNAGFLVAALYDTILQNLDSLDLEDLVEDLLTLVERGLKRRLRLRRRDERLDRRMLRETDEEDLAFEDSESISKPLRRFGSNIPRSNDG